MGVVSWIMRASSSSMSDQGSLRVKRWPLGPAASKMRVSPPFTPSRPTRNTATRSTPSRCAPSGVGRPMPSVVSMRNWWASRNQRSGPSASACCDRPASAASSFARPAATRWHPAWARTSAACRRAGRCSPAAASGRGAAPAAARIRPPRSRSAAAGGSGRRPSGIHRAAARANPRAAPAAPRAARRSRRRCPRASARHSPCCAGGRRPGRAADREGKRDVRHVARA